MALVVRGEAYLIHDLEAIEKAKASDVTVQQYDQFTKTLEAAKTFFETQNSEDVKVAYGRARAAFCKISLPNTTLEQLKCALYGMTRILMGQDLKSNPQKSFCITPLIAAVILKMTLAGISDVKILQHNADLFRQLGITTTDDNILNKALVDLVNASTTPSETQQVPQVNMSNALIIGNKIVIVEKFFSLMNDIFKAKPFQDKKKAEEWVKEKTNGVINAHFPEETFPLSIYGLTAFYFKAFWESQFPLNFTGPSSFTAMDGSVSQVQMMYQEKTFKVFKGANFRALILPYKGNKQLQCVILLPNHPKDLADLASNLSLSQVREILKNAQTAFVKLSFPKQKIDQELQLLDRLKESGFLPKQPITLDRAVSPIENGSAELQKFAIRVKAVFNELGTEIAALGQLQGLARGEAEIFQANQPHIVLVLANDVPLLITVNQDGTFLVPFSEDEWVQTLITKVRECLHDECLNHEYPLERFIIAEREVFQKNMTSETVTFNDMGEFCVENKTYKFYDSVTKRRYSCYPLLNDAAIPRFNLLVFKDKEGRTCVIDDKEPKNNNPFYWYLDRDSGLFLQKFLPIEDPAWSKAPIVDVYPDYTLRAMHHDSKVQLLRDKLKAKLNVDPQNPVSYTAYTVPGKDPNHKVVIKVLNYTEEDIGFDEKRCLTKKGKQIFTLHPEKEGFVKKETYYSPDNCIVLVCKDNQGNLVKIDMDLDYDYNPEGCCVYNSKEDGFSIVSF